MSKIDNNANLVCDIPVRELHEFALDYADAQKDEIQIFIATPENVMDEIELCLSEYGFKNYVRLDSSRWAQMQRNACLVNGIFEPLEKYPIGFHVANIRVYKAKFHKDKKLQTRYQEADYISSIQVGAAMTDIRVAEVLDCIGDNISEKNGNYSELTGLYWIWKNRIQNRYYGEDCYFGLAHYRRFLELSDDDLLRLKDNDIDVVLPYPMPYEPNIEAHHERYLTDAEWSGVLKALEELEPQYANVFKDILKQEYLYNYNVILAKREVLEQYCSWLFPILFRIEEINNPDGMKEANRYIGYVGETLETLYFMYNKDMLRIVHAGCKFLV